MSSEPKKQIVVLGAGFAGIRAALDTAKHLPQSRVLLVSHAGYHVYHPVLYEAATTVKSDGPAFALKGTLAFAITDIIGRRRNIAFKQAWVQSIDQDRKIVRTDDGDFAYDYLVVALGSQTDYFNIPGLAQHGLPLKSFADAVVLRNRIARALDQYKVTGDNNYLHFVIGGGGFTGTEFAAELINYLKHLRRQYAVVPELKLWIVEGGPQLLPGLPTSAGALILRRVRQLGIDVMLNARIIEVDENGAILQDGQRLPARTVIWTGGVKSSAVPFIKNLACDKKGRTIVSSRLNLESYPEVFIVGDCACYMDPAKGAPLPPTAQVAVHQAKYVAKAIAADGNGRETLFYRPPKNHKFLVPLSGKCAVFVSGQRVWSGFWPYTLRRLTDLRYFLSILPLRRALSFWFKGSMIYVKND